jgi:hypothetical protein
MGFVAAGCSWQRNMCTRLGVATFTTLKTNT